MNDWNEQTKGIMHLLVTPLCDRECPYCCNKQYDLKDIPYATDEEFRQCHTVCLTGGEPFKYANPAYISSWIKSKYRNIKKVYVYGNAAESYDYLNVMSVFSTTLNEIDGVTLSIKTPLDKWCFENMVNNPRLAPFFKQDGWSNLLYVFDDLNPESQGNFKVIKRGWQKSFKPDEHSFFRKV